VHVRNTYNIIAINTTTRRTYPPYTLYTYIQYYVRLIVTTCIIIMCIDIRRIESHAIVYHECTTAAAVRYLQNFAFLVVPCEGTSSCRTTTLSLLLYSAVCVYTSRISTYNNTHIIIWYRVFVGFAFARFLGRSSVVPFPNVFDTL